MTKLQQKISEKDLKLADLAREFEVSDQAIQYMVKSKKYKDSYQELKKWSEILDCDIEELLD